MDSLLASRQDIELEILEFFQPEKCRGNMESPLKDLTDPADFSLISAKKVSDQSVSSSQKTLHEDTFIGDQSLKNEATSHQKHFSQYNNERVAQSNFCKSEQKEIKSLVHFSPLNFTGFKALDHQSPLPTLQNRVMNASAQSLSRLSLLSENNEGKASPNLLQNLESEAVFNETVDLFSIERKHIACSPNPYSRERNLTGLKSGDTVQKCSQQRADNSKTPQVIVEFILIDLLIPALLG